MTARNRGIGDPSMIDRMLASKASQPAHEPPARLRADIMDRVRADMRQRATESARPSRASAFFWRFAGGALGVAAVAGAWLFALQAWGVRQPASGPDGRGVAAAPTPLAVVASIDDRLLQHSQGAVTRLATAVNASYRREIDAMEIDARNAAVRAAEYATWLRAPIAPAPAPAPTTDF